MARERPVDQLWARLILSLTTSLLGLAEEHAGPRVNQLVTGQTPSNQAHKELALNQKAKMPVSHGGHHSSFCNQNVLVA